MKQHIDAHHADRHASAGEDLMEETHLIQNARQGDLEAFNQLVLKFQDAVYNQALWFLRDQDVAEDFTQEAFIRAFQNLQSYRGGSFRSWLLRITANVCLDELRRLKRKRVLSLTRITEEDEELEAGNWLRDPADSVEDTVEQADLRAGLRRCIDELPQEFRQCIFLVDVLEMDYSEAAQAMGVPMGTLKSRLARARLQLRRRLENSTGLLPDRLLEPT